MKSFAISTLAAFFLSLAAPSGDVAAQLQQQTSKFFSTRVQGDLVLPPSPSGALAGFRCGNITVVATSKDRRSASRISSSDTCLVMPSVQMSMTSSHRTSVVTVKGSAREAPSAL